MNILRWIVMLAAWLGFIYSSSWLASGDNSLADTTSCFEYCHLLSMAPYMQKKPCTLHPLLCGIKHTLTCLPESHTSSSTASLLCLERPIGWDKSPLQTSSYCTPSSGTQTAQSCPRCSQPCSNGYHGWEGSTAFS